MISCAIWNKQAWVNFFKDLQNCANRASAIFQIARDKSFNYVLVIYTKKYDIAYHNYAEAKRVHQVQK